MVFRDRPKHQPIFFFFFKSELEQVFILFYFIFLSHGSTAPSFLYAGQTYICLSHSISNSVLTLD